MNRISKRRLAQLRSAFAYNPDVLTLIDHYSRKPDEVVEGWAGGLVLCPEGGTPCRGIIKSACIDEKRSPSAWRRVRVDVYYLDGKGGKRNG